MVAANSDVIKQKPERKVLPIFRMPTKIEKNFVRLFGLNMTSVL